MSSPPVRIESKAWTDTRYKTLALLLGLADRDFALIRVAAIWRWQTEHYTDAAPTYVVSRSVVIGALDSLKGPEALVEADLAVLEPDGRLRIRGGRDDKGRSRIDWLWEDRKKKSAAGRASAEARKAAGDPRGDDGRFNSSRTDAEQNVNTDRTTAEPESEQPPSSLVSGLRSLDPASQALTGSPISAPSGASDLRAGSVPVEAVEKPRRAKPRKRAPEDPASDPEPTDADRAYADEFGVDIANEWPAMFDSYRRREETTSDWSSSWRTWCRNDKKFRTERQARAGPGRPSQTAASALPGIFDQIAALEAEEQRK